MQLLIIVTLLLALCLSCGVWLLTRLNRVISHRTALAQPASGSLEPGQSITSRRVLISTALLSIFGLGLLALGLITSVSQVQAQSPGATVGTAKTLAGNATSGSYPSGAEFVFYISYSCAAITDPTCTNVVITDTLNPALQFVSASSLPNGATASQVGNNVVINFGTLDAGANGVIQVKVRFALGTLPGTTITNTSTIDADNAHATTSNPPISVTATGNFQMTANKGVINNAQTGVIGTQFATTYQLNICNPNNGVGGVPLNNPVITDTLPAQATPILPIPMGGTYLSATHQIRWQGGVNGFPAQIPVTSGCFTINVPVLFDPSTPGVAAGTNVTNQFQARGNPADNPASTVTLGPAGHALILQDPSYNASLGKSAAAPSDHPDDPGVEELPGGPVTYTLTYRNQGTLPITNVVVTDVIPPQIATVTTVAVNPITAGQTVTFSYELDNSGSWITDLVTTTNASRNLSGVPGKVTGLRWDLGDVPLDTPAWSVTFNAMLSSTLSGGDSANNCASATGYSGNSVRPESACAQVDLIDQRAIPRTEKLISDSSPQLPGSVVTYTLRVYNDDVAHHNVVAPLTLADLVPEELEVVVFDSGSFRPATALDSWYTYSGAAPAPTAVFTPTYGPDNTTFVSWQWAGPYQLAAGEALTVTFAVRIKKGTPPGNLDNVSLMLWEPTTTNPLPCVGSQNYTDTLDIDEDGNTSETGCQSDNSPTRVGVFLAMASEKFVLGELDGGIWNKDGVTIPGGRVNYRMVITNLSNVTTTNLLVYDIFPFVGDTGVIDLKSRESDWRPNLQTNIETPPGVPLSLQYSQSGNPCRTELIASGPAGCTNDWSSTPPADLTSVQAVRLNFCDSGGCLELPPDRGNGLGGTLVLTWHMQAPNDAPVEPERAWNSFGFTAAGSGLTLLPAEPNKVGIRVRQPAANTVNLGNYVWLDVSGLQNDGIQQPEEPGINGVRVELRDENSNPVDLDSDGQVDFRITGNDASGNPGYYLFVGLPVGVTYTVRFYPPVTYTLGLPLPVTYNLSPGNSVITDELDSDGITPGTDGTYGPYIQTGLITTTLALTTDLRWDQGLWLPTDYGDAPNSYNTQASTLLTPANAARHVILPGIYLGAGVDAELDGDPGITSFGDDVNDGNDDEDGVTFDYYLGTPAQPTPIMLIGSTSRLTVSTTIPTSYTGYLNVWLDFNRDGDFDDAGEQIATDQAAPSGGGNLSLSVLVPTTAMSGTSYARFRFSSQQGLGPSSAALDGEVEDYPVMLRPGDFGDLPNTYGTLVANNGARHVITETNNPTLGTNVDDEFNGQPNAGASDDDTNKSDDEDGVVFNSELIPGEVMTVTVIASSAAAGLLNAWIDFTNDGDFNDANERLATDRFIAAGDSVVLTTTVPVTAAQNSQAYARFRFSSQGGLPPTGLAFDGEVEDYTQPILPLDYGDLPNSSIAAPPDYLTTYTDNGPRHIIRTSGGNPTLGSRVDAESNGQPNAASTGDDTNNSTILTHGSSAGDDENGVTFNTPWVPGKVATITVTTLAAGSGGVAGLLNAWIDFNNNGLLGDPGEQIATNLNLAAGATQTITFSVPSTATLGNSYSRFRFSTASDLTPSGLAANGEVEDYRNPIVQLDYGDAPNSFGTTDSASGAYHIINSTYRLGLIVDAELDGQPSTNADGDDATTGPATGGAPGDDEDGISFNTPIAPGAPATITVRVAGSGRLNGWIDFNGSGVFESGERIFTNQSIAASGSYSLSFTVPATATLGQQYARFRYSSSNLSGPTGPANDGEVEDYRVEIVELDYGDLPNASIAGSPDYLTTLSDNGARHIILPTNNPILGSLIDSEPTGQPSANASGDGADEDGVTFLSDIIPGETMALTVTAGPFTGGVLNAWIDFNGDGDFDDLNEQLALDRAINAAETITLTANVPLTATQGITAYSRFRFSSVGGLNSSGLASDGEVEDYGLPIQRLDYGDLPNGLAAYPTGYASGGARHVILASNNPTLGPSVDAESDGNASANAVGDDANGSDDEDGVSFNTLLVPGKVATITVAASGANGRLNGWIDFDGDGQLDAGEQIVTDVALTAGTSISLSFTVPATATLGPANTRFRYSTATGLTPAGLASNGEVEDYQVNIGEIDYGDLPDSYNTTDSQGGAFHIISSTLYLGSLVDAELDGQPSPNATGDDTATSDDEDGLTFASPLAPGEVATITVAAVGSANLSGWLDFNGSGSFDPGERIFTNRPLASGSSTLTFTVPVTAVPGSTGARFRYTSDSLTSHAGLANDGEVEDYLVSIDQLDLGDLPDSSSAGPPAYPTIRADNGPRHIISATVYLGSRVDVESDGQPSASALGDDAADTSGTPANGSDDEDGIRFLTPLMPGQTAQIEVSGTGGVLNAWIDFSGDGDFNDAGEYIFTEQAVSSGTQTLTITVPAAVTHTLYSRFRLTATPGEATTPTGLAPTGEVEDYVLLSLGNQVWFDSDNNGLINGGETGVPGVTMTLVISGTTTPIATTITNGTGNYLFTGLTPGDYQVIIPAESFQPGGSLFGYTSSAVTDANADNSDDGDDNGLDHLNPAANGISSSGLTLSLGGEPSGDGNGPNSNLTVDFGFVLVASLGDYVWIDADGDGEQDSGEVGLNGVTVNLWTDTDNNGTPDTMVLTATTTITGYYQFVNLIPGVAYQVEFVLPPSYDFTLPDQVGDTIDSDADFTTGFTPIITLTPGENNDTIDAGLYQASIQLEKTVAIAEIVPQQVVSYTITITNTGNVRLNPVAVTDTLDAGLIYIPGSASPPEDVVNGQQLVWNDVMDGVGLAPGASTQIILPVSVTTLTGVYLNTACAEGVHPTGSVIDTDTVPVIVSDPAVALDKEVVAPGAVDGIITFTLRLTNTGPSVLDQVPLFDAFTGPVEYLGGTPPADTVDQVNQQLVWNNLTTSFGNLIPGQAVVVTTVFRLTISGTEFSMTNLARVSGADDVFNNQANDDQDTVNLINVPTAIDLLYFTSTQEGQAVRLNWATAVEYDNYGFRLLRSATGNLADATEVTFIPGQGHGTVAGASYTYLDQTASMEQTYTYWLVDVDFNGTETVHNLTTAIRLNAGGGYRYYLPILRQ